MKPVPCETAQSLDSGWLLMLSCFIGSLPFHFTIILNIILKLQQQIMQGFKLCLCYLPKCLFSLDFVYKIFPLLRL